jgi:starch phosphorylase
LNLAFDGWWRKYDKYNGFAIGTGWSHADPGVQWQRDAHALYDVLEQEVVPLFYDRDAAGLPRGWIARMKQSIMSLAWRYNADRMVTDYVTASYLPAAGGLPSA